MSLPGSNVLQSTFPDEPFINSIPDEVCKRVLNLNVNSVFLPDASEVRMDLEVFVYLRTHECDESVKLSLLGT